MTTPPCLCHIIVEDQKYALKERGIVISIVHCDCDIGNTHYENIFEFPFVLGRSGAGLYFLCGEVSSELERFVATGKQPADDKGTNKEYHVFTREQEAKMICRLTALGLTVTYHRHQIELADRITIAYIKVRNPQSDVNVSLIPWFMVAGRPYPIFAYVYAIGHYQRMDRKSLEESAASVRKLFGISSFHKSTVSRSISTISEFINISKIDRPLSIDELKKPVCPICGQAASCHDEDDIVNQVSELLTAYPSHEALEAELGGKAKRLPEPIKRPGTASQALSKLPDEHFQIIICNEPCGTAAPDRRKRPPRPRAKRSKLVQRPLKFVAHTQREEKRKSFIASCRHITLDAAIKYHRFLV